MANSFRSLSQFVLPPTTVWLLGEVAEQKGRQALHEQQPDKLLHRLRESALVESVESSNRIEGVVVPRNRLRPLILEDHEPQDRSELEIRGYRRALELIFQNPQGLSLFPETLLTLHRLCQEGSGDAGQLKRLDNEIIERDARGAPHVCFRCVAAAETPAAAAELCLHSKHVLSQERLSDLVVIAATVLDFLCIHPFRDGNGRVSRLLALLLLLQQGYVVGRYISLERLTEEAKDDYYATLQQSSQGWHEGQHDLIPWLNHFLGTIRRAYAELERQVEAFHPEKGSKSQWVQEVIAKQPGSFSVVELEAQCPGVSRDLIRGILKRLRQEGAVKSLGRGPGALWRKRVNPPEKG